MVDPVSSVPPHQTNKQTNNVVVSYYYSAVCVGGELHGPD
jgi:hypothetical protein